MGTRARILAIGVAVGLGVSTLTACTSPRHAALGDVLVASRVPEEIGTGITFHEPAEDVAISVGTPREHLDADQVIDGRSESGYDAPDGATFVRLDVIAGPVIDPPQAHSGGLIPHPLTLGVAVGARSYPVLTLPAPRIIRVDDKQTRLETLRIPNRWVVVPDTADAPLHLTLAYDGVTQTAQVASGEIDAGLAAELYTDEPRVLAADVHSAVRGRVRGGRVTTTVETGRVYLTPYTASRGWAEAGTVWATVDVGVYHIELPTGGLGELRTLSFTPRLDGRRPVRAAGTRSTAHFGHLGVPAAITQVVFAVPADHPPARLRVGLRGTLYDGSRTGRAFRAATTFRLRTEG